MKVINNVDYIIDNVITSISNSKKKHFVILIGGCSRSGKSSLSDKLINIFKSKGQNALLCGIDSWLISLENRTNNSVVIDRYDVDDICLAVNELINCKSVIQPTYDLVSRKRKKDIKGTTLFLESGILIIEGTITLAIENLVKLSDLNVYVETSEFKRKKRLIQFYSTIKKLSRLEYKKIIQEREQEEVPFIKKSVENAHIIFQLLHNTP